MDTVDLFDLLSDATRIEVILVLAEHPAGLAFSELANRMQVDDTGRLNYHLKRLRPVLVDKRNDCYVLTEDGRDVLAWIEG